MEENSKKSKLKYLIKPVAFVTILLFCITGLSILFRTFLDAKSIRINGYQYEEENSLDLIAIGNSNIYSSFIPALMYDEFGYTSYNCGQSEQNLEESYKILKNMFKTQSPSVVFLETENMFVHKNDFLQSLSRDFYSIMNHDNWKAFGKVFTEKGRERLTLSKGYLHSSAVSAYYDEDNYMAKNNKKRVTMKPKYEKRLLDIVDLCKNHRAELILMKVPSVYTWSQKRSDFVENFAKKHDLKFIDFNTNYEESGLDLTTDTRDRGDHLNVFGAIKVTRFLGNYINTNCAITRKGCKDKQNWQKCVKQFRDSI